MNGRYTFDDSGKPVREPDLLKWTEWFEDIERRRVKKEQIDDSEVSTIFLGLDHNYEHSGDPILWETMVFGGKLNGAQDRCGGNREQAEAMHAKMVKHLKQAK